MKSLGFLSLVLIVLYACSSPESGANAEQANEATSVDTNSQKVNYVLTPFTSSAEFQDAKIVSVNYSKGKFDYKIGGKTYKLGEQTSDAPQKMCANSKQGQHIHLIVDDQPYAAKYEAAFDYEIPDGEHYILSFLSRSYHESIKTKDASLAEKVTVKNNGFVNREKITTPMLFYSRPKGEYIGKSETDKVMLDFFTVNAPLGENFKVEVEINGEFKQVLDTWQPYYIEGLPLGDNKIKLTLLDGAGQPAAVPLNPVERVFTLKADPAPGQ